MFEEIKKSARILGDVFAGKALAETLVPKARNYVKIELLRANGTRSMLADGYNARVNQGALWQAGIMGSAAGVPANYVALGTATITAAAADTSLASEILSATNAGLARVLGTYQNFTAPASLGSSASYQITKTFTSSGSATVNSAALMYTSSGVGMFVEANLSPPATLASGDQLVLTWTINI